MTKLTRYETETVINYNDAEKKAYISSAQKPVRRRLQKLAEEHPDEVVITEDDGCIMFAEVPKYYIKIRPKRYVSEEQRQAAAGRLRQYREKKANSQKLSEAEEADMADIEDEIGDPDTE